MAFDGAFLHKITEELKSGINSHVDKIYQPSRDELVFLLRKKGFVKRLLITVKQGSARIHFTENKYENPAVPPNFCMLLRKYLSSARLIDIKQPRLERVAELHFSATNEMGDTVILVLVCELIGNQANVILLKDGKILDALRRSDPQTAKRLILPGATYEYPESLKKKNPLTEDLSQFLSDTNSNISKTLLDNIDGFSPLVCREIEFKSQSTSLNTALNSVIEDIKINTKPVLLLNPNKTALDFSYTEINQYGADYENKILNNFSLLLDTFYTDKDTVSRINAAAHDIIKLVNNLISRTKKKLSLRLIELEKCKDRETLRIYGELIKANLHLIENGSNFAEVVNYYDENLNTVRIPMNPALTPAKNADKYFKDYKKTYTAEQTLSALTKQDEEELLYFDSVLLNISRSKTLAEIAEIRAELGDAGYLKQAVTQKTKKSTSLALAEEKSIEGYRIVIGKNNTQNDYITTKLASRYDLWFHTKNIPGSHVVVMCGGNEVSEETILFAASLAAQNSKAANSTNVPVDYTSVKYVKKPVGAKPGMVIYTTNKTVYVTPSQSI